jgi:hypothetical protein
MKESGKKARREAAGFPREGYTLYRDAHSGVRITLYYPGERPLSFSGRPIERLAQDFGGALGKVLHPLYTGEGPDAEGLFREIEIDREEPREALFPRGRA